MGTNVGCKIVDSGLYLRLITDKCLAMAFSPDYVALFQVKCGDILILQADLIARSDYYLTI